METIQEHYDVIIIGAGISGLAAANNLILNGFNVLILEGRERIGGRIHSESFANAIIDLGASWIHGVEENPITRLAKKHGIITERSHMAGLSTTKILHSEIFDHNFAKANHTLGMRITDWMADFIDFLDLMDGNPLLHEQSIKDLKNQFIEQANISKDDRIYLDYIVDTMFLYEYAIDAEELSAATYHSDHIFAGHDRLFPKGYGQISDLMAKGLPISCNQVVRQIDYSGDFIEVFTETHHLQASYALITVPLGVLQQGELGFSPHLPSDKRKAIKKLKMGTLNKIYLEFPSIFWDPQVESIACLSTEDKIIREIISLYPLTQKPILMVFTAGARANQLEKLSDKELITLVMSSLSKAYGDHIPQPSNVRITRWHSDPFSHGSYSYLPVDVKTKTRKRLAEPVNNKVFFAGEATSLYFPSTVHGAFLSGVRAAYEILQTDLLTEDVRRKTSDAENLYL